MCGNLPGQGGLPCESILSNGEISTICCQDRCFEVDVTVWNVPFVLWTCSDCRHWCGYCRLGQSREEWPFSTLMMLSNQRTSLLNAIEITTIYMQSILSTSILYDAGFSSLSFPSSEMVSPGHSAFFHLFLHAMPKYWGSFPGWCNVWELAGTWNVCHLWVWWSI